MTSAYIKEVGYPQGRNSHGKSLEVCDRALARAAVLARELLGQHGFDPKTVQAFDRLRGRDPPAWNGHRIRVLHGSRFRLVVRRRLAIGHLLFSVEHQGLGVLGAEHDLGRSCAVVCVLLQVTTGAPSDAGQ